MAWRDRLRGASFRGVPFFVDTERSGPFGRRAQVHEYVGRDQHFVEDLGERTPRHRLSAFTIGPDHDLAARRLVAACRAGSGRLVHPTLGELEVLCERCEQTVASTREGGLTGFELTFVAVGKNRAPQARVDTQAAVAEIAATAQQGAIADFGQTFATQSWPDWIADAATALVDDLVDELESAAGRFVGGRALVADLARDIGAVRSGVLGLVLSPLDLANAVSALFNTIGALDSDARQVRTVLASLVTWGPEESPVATTTATRQREKDNHKAFLALARSSAVIEVAKASAQIEFESYDEAAAVRDELTEQIDAEAVAAGEIGSDALYVALQELYAAVSKDITARGANLARVTTVVPDAELPALVLAQDLYGDAARADEIVARNGIRHPAFVPGGQALEILSDVGGDAGVA